VFEINSQSEYQEQIRRLFQSEFPTNSVKTDADLLELITDAIISTGKVRLRPKPSVESLYTIRQHISSMMAAGEPIRFLMPWGSEKPGHLETVDKAKEFTDKAFASGSYDEVLQLAMTYCDVS
jgi:hypothetical protein